MMSIRTSRIAALALIGSAFCQGASLAQPAPVGPAPIPPGEGTLTWEVVNRFRLFKRESDFARLEKAYNDAGRSVLAMEQALGNADGRGWARDVLNHTCADLWSGLIRESCERDGISERYYNPRDHRVRISASFDPAFANATCQWTIAGRRTAIAPRPCSQPLDERVPFRQTTQVKVVASLGDGRTAEATADIAVRDLMIVGMGDSIASGEGNPEQAVRLGDNGICYRRFRGGSPSLFYLPRREASNVDTGCPPPSDLPDQRQAWDAGRANWLFAGCHRSLYGHQVRTALALAFENRQSAVTYLPLGCSGATIRQGLLGSQPARERLWRDGRRAEPTIEAQMTQLVARLGGAGRTIVRRPDIILLTVGANDIGFSELVANVMIQGSPERGLAGRMMTDIAAARVQLDRPLRRNFAELRRRLATVIGPDLSRVIFTSYGNPALGPNGVCGSGRYGFDIHPAFSVDGALTQSISKFVDDEMFKTLARYARCEAGSNCADRRHAMTFVDAHQPHFAGRGFCARNALRDPDFDTACFRDDGQSFRTDSGGLDQPLACNRSARAFRPYSPRTRWIRTPNDSYFTAMSYPDSLPFFVQGIDIRDAIWGLTATVYGGAIHPTAEGHAAMADAVLVAARQRLGLPALAAVTARMR